jgi:HD-like signal output (HDOD) protein
MARLLFVHDDLSTTERVVRLIAQREPGWGINTAASEDDAWDVIEGWAPDAVVAAARPPGLDGLRLLVRVRDHHPRVVRIALGVDPDAEQGLRTLRIAHRALVEPVDAGALLELLRRMLLLTSLVSQPRLRELLGRIESLPPVPSVYTKLSRRLEDPNASVFELGEMVSADSTLAAQVLRMANSAYFARHQRVTKIEAAAARLGTRLLRSLVLAAEAFGRFPVSPFMVERLEALQAHASLVARIASSLEPQAAWKDDAFAAGLLHDIGKLLLAAHLPEQHAGIVREAERTHRPEHDVELQHLGLHHGTLGACLLGMWGLPSVVLEAAHLHHEPLQQLPAVLDPVVAVTVANGLAHAVHDPDHAFDHMRPWADALLADPRWPAWRDLATEAAQAEEAA